MADETSSIALQLNVQLRGLINLTKLNTALVDLKKNARGFQQDLGKGNATLGNVGKKAKEAADGLAKLTKANRDLAASAVGGGKTKTINDHMAAQFKTLQRDMAKEAAAGARKRMQTETMYGRLFDQIERQNQASAKRTSAVRESLRRREIAGLQREYQMRQRVSEMEKSLAGRLRLYEEMNDAIFRAGFRLQMLGNDMEALGRKTIGALTAMSKEFGDFEFMVNRAAGATGIMTDEVTGGVNIYNKFQGAIMEAAQELRLFNPTDVAKATYFWASTSGQQVDTLEQLESVMRSVNPLMKIAAMTETSYETAIKGVYSILVQYGLGLEHVQEVTEKLHMVTQRTAAEFPDLINSFKMVGPVAKEFGVTFDDMVVLLGRLADAGVRGTMSGRAFRQFFIQISRPAPKATAALDELWKSTQKFGTKSYIDTVFPEGKFIGVNQYVDELAKRLQFATDKERMFTLATITTANELPVLTALVSKQIAELNGLVGGWDKTKENLDNAAEGFKRSWEILRTSWNGTVGALTRGVEIIRMKVGERIAKIFTPVLEQITTHLVRLREWFAKEENGPIVDFFVRLAGASAVVLTLGGGLTVLVGVLVAMTAAFRVAYRAFSPLFGLFGKIGGVIAGLAIAIIRNFDYIKDTFIEAGETIKEAMEGSEETISSLGDAVGAFSNVFAPVFDTVIRIFGELILVVSRVTAFILKNEAAVNILGVAANVLGGIIAGRLVLAIVSMTAAMGKALVVGGLMKILAVDMAVRFTALNAAMAASAAGGGLKGLKAGLQSLLPMLGRGGALAVGIAAVSAALLILYTNSNSVRTAVDRFIFETVTSLQELRDAAQEARRALGDFGPEAEHALSLDPVFRKMRDNVENMRRLTSGFKDDFIITIDERAQLRSLDIMEKDLEAYTRDTYNTYQDWVQQINDLGGNVTIDQFMDRLVDEAARLNTHIADPRVVKSVNNYFRGIAFGAKEANAEAARLTGTMDTMLNAKSVSPSLIITEEQKKTNLARLMGLQAGGKLDPEAAAEVTRQIELAQTAGIEGVEPPAAAETAKVWSGVADSLISSGKAVFDFGKIMKQVIKDSLDSREIVKHLREHTREFLSGGFGKPTPESWATLAGFWQSIQERNQTLVDLMTPAQFKKYADETIKGFLKDFKNGFPEDMPEEVKQVLISLIEDLYAKTGVPIPQNVLDVLYGRGSETIEEVNKGMKDKAKVEAIVRSAKAARDGATAGFKPTDMPRKHGSKTSGDFLKGLRTYQKETSTTASKIGNSTRNISKYMNSSYAWGEHMAEEFARGLRSQIQAVQNAARRLAGVAAGPLEHSTPKIGPLAGDDKWGEHMGENIASGLNRSSNAVRAAAMNVARAASLAYTYSQENLATSGVNVESTANRIIKVQVEVTSPDGSVDRLKAAELERGLMTSDLILAIEHMAVVG